MKREKIDKARLLALRVLSEVNEEGAFSNESLDRHFLLSSLDSREKAFASALVYGTLSRQFGLDIQIKRFSRIATEAMDPEVRNILRLGAWQIYYSFSVPKTAAVDESVKLCRYMGKSSAAGMVNAVLRGLSRSEPVFNRRERGPSLGLSKEMFGYFRKWYGEETAAAIAQSFLDQDYSFSLRCNCKRISVPDLKQMLTEEGCAVEDGRWMERALRIRSLRLSLNDLQSFRDGLWMVQDEAAQLVGALSGAERAAVALDLCAAPGGKSLDLYERMPEGAVIAGIDISDERLQKARENALRMRADVRFYAADASSRNLLKELAGLNPAFGRGADIVLADVPCSGLGLLGRKPEIRLRIEHEKLQRFPAIQDAILHAAAPCVRAGGTLIYSTCTLNPEENEERVRAFLSSEEGREFTPPASLPGLPSALKEILRKDERCVSLLRESMLLLRPDLSGTDGFFIAVLERKGTS